MILLKTILDVNQLLIGIGIFVFAVKAIPIMIRDKTTKVDLATVLGDKLFGFLMIVMIINAISYFFLKDTYIDQATSELKKSIAKSDSLFFSNDNIYLDTNKIYPCDMGGKYLDDSIYTFALSDNTVITLQQFRNDTTKYGIQIINQVGFFNHNPIAIFKAD